LWELCPFELKNFPKYTSEAASQHNSSETTEQNFMKLGKVVRTPYVIEHNTRKFGSPKFCGSYLP
jgi:hypothetical protein